MTKRTRTSDTVSGAIDNLQEALKPLPAIPAHVKLRDCDKPFWIDILRARARNEWTELDLILAAQLARCQADIEIEQDKIYAEGSITVNDRGTSVTNPRLRALNELKQSQLATVKALALNATAKADPRDIGKKRQAFFSAREVAEEAQEDDLLAR
jgi:hypothetical protein